MSTRSDLYHNRNDFDFPRMWKKTMVLSTILMVISVAAVFGRGLNLSIDFEGGSIWEIPSSSFDETEAREVLGDFGPEAGEKFQEATTADGTRVLRVSGRVDDIEEATSISESLAEAAGLEPGEVTVSTVGPSWGDDITRQARTSLIVFMVLVALYIAWRLETRMAVAAMVAVVHDIVLTVGVYAVFQLQLTPATVISFLTILGFSLYDTIVVYDRVQENSARLGRTGRYTYSAIMRRSLNQVFMRSLNTTITTILPIVSMLVVGSWAFGQRTLGDFSVALLIGLISGTYSSLFVAAPLTAWLKEREPRWAEIRSRLVAKGVDPSDTAWRGVQGSVSVGEAGPLTSASTAASRSGTDVTPISTAPPTSFGSHPPRPRKKKR